MRCRNVIIDKIAVQSIPFSNKKHKQRKHTVSSAPYNSQKKKDFEKQLRKGTEKYGKS